MGTEPRRPAERFHPGEYIEEELAARGWGIGRLSQRSGMSVVLIQSLIARKTAITVPIASLLSKAFGMSPKLWLNLQETYERLAEDKLSHIAPGCTELDGEGR